MKNLLNVVVFSSVGLCFAGKKASSTDDLDLNKAVRCNEISEIEALLAQGANPNTPLEAFGRTIFHGAVCRISNFVTPFQDKDLQTVETLLSKGKVNPNISDDYQWTPLHDATAKCHLPVVKMLLAHGANTMLRDVRGYTALETLQKGECRKEQDATTIELLILANRCKKKQV